MILHEERPPVGIKAELAVLLIRDALAVHVEHLVPAQSGMHLTDHTLLAGAVTAVNCPSVRHIGRNCANEHSVSLAAFPASRRIVADSSAGLLARGLS